jgi:nucleoside-diphosphate-sugar epimerase
MVEANWRFPAMNEYLLPDKIESEEELDDLLSKPTKETIKDLSEIDGDMMILGVAGKIGPTLAKLIKRAVDEGGLDKRVIGVSRFSNPSVANKLALSGIEVISCDLLDEDAVNSLPEISNIIFMVGRKFGTEEDNTLTWATNIYLPALVAKKFRRSRIVVFSTGNVYPMVKICCRGADESVPPDPIGEYAQSCLGRERIFEYFCRKYGAKALFLRLNYAIDLRYGVLLDIAQKVFSGAPVNLAMGYVNVIWQGDVNNIAARSLKLCSNPPEILNVTGPEIIPVRWLAKQFGKIFGKEPIFEGKEAEDALLSDATRCHMIFGYPKVTLGHMIKWVAHWVTIGGPTLGKPTHFEVRDGRF